MTHTELFNIELEVALAAKHVELYKEHLTGAFNFEAMVLKMVEEIFEHNVADKWNIPAFIEWTMSNKDNSLPFESSGSFMTALKDVDNFISHIESWIQDRREITEDDYEKIEELYKNPATLEELNNDIDPAGGYGLQSHI